MSHSPSVRSRPAQIAEQRAAYLDLAERRAEMFRDLADTRAERYHDQAERRAGVGGPVSGSPYRDLAERRLPTTGN